VDVTIFAGLSDGGRLAKAETYGTPSSARYRSVVREALAKYTAKRFTVWREQQQIQTVLAEQFANKNLSDRPGAPSVQIHGCH
jgi:hypothetical protein